MILCKDDDRCQVGLTNGQSLAGSVSVQASVDQPGQGFWKHMEKASTGLRDGEKRSDIHEVRQPLGLGPFGRGYGQRRRLQ